MNRFFCRYAAVQINDAHFYRFRCSYSLCLSVCVFFIFFPFVWACVLMCIWCAYENVWMFTVVIVLAVGLIWLFVHLSGCFRWQFDGEKIWWMETKKKNKEWTYPYRINKSQIYWFKLMYCVAEYRSICCPPVFIYIEYVIGIALKWTEVYEQNKKIKPKPTIVERFPFNFVCILIWLRLINRFNSHKNESKSNVELTISNLSYCTLFFKSNWFVFVFVFDSISCVHFFFFLYLHDWQSTNSNKFWTNNGRITSIFEVTNQSNALSYTHTHAHEKNAVKWTNCLHH